MTLISKDDNETLHQVIKQLKAALQSCVYDVELDWGGDTGMCRSLCRAPRHIPPLYHGTR